MVAIAGDEPCGSVLNVLLVLVFVAIMIFGVRRALPRWLGTDRLAREEPSKGTLATIVVCWSPRR